MGEHTAEDRGVEGSIPSRPIEPEDVEGEENALSRFPFVP